MLIDLQYRVGIAGKTRAEVYRLLGKADDEGYVKGSDRWHLCPSFLDVYVLQVEWQGDLAVSAIAHDT